MVFQVLWRKGRSRTIESVDAYDQMMPTTTPHTKPKHLQRHNLGLSWSSDICGAAVQQKTPLFSVFECPAENSKVLISIYICI